MKQALLITGELRFKSKDHFEQFYTLIKRYDVFISTYEEYSNICSKITDNYILHPRSITHQLPFKRSDVHAVGAMLQYFHLDSVVSRYKNELLKYKYILKLRPDLIFNSEILIHDKQVEPDTLYAASDLMFYATSHYFIQVFENYFDKIKTEYWDMVERYIPLNYDNILKSEIKNADVNTQAYNGVRFNWLVLPSNIIEALRPEPENFNKFKEVIHQNYNFLQEFNSNQKNLPVDKFRNFPKQFKFSAEQIFAAHAFNNGPVKNPDIHIKLFPGRYSFKFKT